jgi:hypothetical protein
MDATYHAEGSDEKPKLTPPWPLRYDTPVMSRYIARTCPKCRDYFDVTVSQQPTSEGEHPVTAYCAVCGYQLKGWSVIVGRKRAPVIDVAGKRKASR